MKWLAAWTTRVPPSAPTIATSRVFAGSASSSAVSDSNLDIVFTVPMPRRSAASSLRSSRMKELAPRAFSSKLRRKFAASTSSRYSFAGAYHAPRTRTPISASSPTFSRMLHSSACASITSTTLGRAASGTRSEARAPRNVMRATCANCAAWPPMNSLESGMISGSTSQTWTIIFSVSCAAFTASVARHAAKSATYCFTWPGSARIFRLNAASPAALAAGDVGSLKPVVVTGVVIGAVSFLPCSSDDAETFRVTVMPLSSRAFWVSGLMTFFIVFPLSSFRVEGISTKPSFSSRVLLPKDSISNKQDPVKCLSRFPDKVLDRVLKSSLLPPSHHTDAEEYLPSYEDVAANHHSQLPECELKHHHRQHLPL